ncbi:MAG: hypothetical protein RIC52_13530 [Amphiplicatus sp.]
MNKLNNEQPFHACICEGVIHDCGSKLGWLQANIDLGLKNSDFSEALQKYIKARVS